MIIRPSKPEDKQFLLDVFKSEDILDGFPMKTEAEIEDSCNFWIDMANRGYGLTCEVDGKLAAMAVLYIPIYDKLKHSSLFSIVVAEAFRRQNIGTSLINALEQLGCHNYGLSIIHLEVYEKNEPAIRLYKKLGYKEYGKQENFIKDKGLYFSKILMEKRFK